ncbi:NAD(P)-dependent oxidoreductase [Brevibacillus daliensis]|uniref:NAD(P)-dependent oxidoreductase n=1 Tax=Brevibacillus daliensis TaxID=2892995 RepID=UPI001E2C6722|nr:NAD(P)-dependent oxidoreductase [Brevibacillus daliensis]
MKIIVIGDIHVDVDFFAKQAAQFEWREKPEITKVIWKQKSKEEFQHLADMIEKDGPEAVKYPKELDQEVVDAEVILTHFCPLPTNLIAKAKNLKLIGTCRGGLEHIAVEEASKRNIPVINAIRNAEPVADFTIGLMYAETRNIARAHQQIKAGKWPKSFVNSPYTANLNEKRVGIIGFGNIGGLVAEKLVALGVETFVYDSHMTEAKIREAVPSVIPVTLDKLYRESDIISLHVRFERGMPPLINKAAFEKMKPSCSLINTSRAYAVDEKALIEALKTKKIAGAALDVFREEPLPSGHPLLEIENVTLTSHIGGDTVAAIPMSPKILMKNIKKFLVH